MPKSFNAILFTVTSVIGSHTAVASQEQAISSAPVLELAPMIVNGHVASVDTFDEIASLQYDRVDYDGASQSSPYCGATFIDAEHVLTAAHCIVTDKGDIDVSKLYFTSVVPQLQNKQDFPYNTQDRVYIKEVHIHPGFINGEAEKWPNDIAILKLQYSANTQSYATFAYSEEYRNLNDEFIAVGHGLTQSTSDTVSMDQATNQDLLKASLTPVSGQVCEDQFGQEVSDKQLCFTGEVNQSTGLENSTCQGDSGGPVYWNNNGEMIQVGVTSFGSAQCGDASYSTTSVFTEITDYQGWMNEVVDGNSRANLVVSESDRTACLDKNANNNPNQLFQCDVNDSYNVDVTQTSGKTNFASSESASEASTSNTGGASSGGGLGIIGSLLLIAAGFRRKRNKS
ncbi:trypsin-like serine protease [Vibrio sp.]|nr:trypsin-like serine protease [Vibrio sp.]